MVVFVYNLLVDIYDKPTGVPDHWQSKAIKIYDPQEVVTEGLQCKVIQYLYDEGFIEDRRTQCDIITGEECND
jgi:hypothetical protein